MTYNIIMSELAAMKSHFDSGFSVTERTTIEKLYSDLLDKRITNLTCGNCYRDAYIEIYAYLRKAGRLPDNEYKLKEGEYLYIFGSGEHKFNPICKEDAEKYLAEHPEAIRMFEKFPEDWQERAGNASISKDSEKVEEINAEEEKTAISQNKKPVKRSRKKTA